MTYALLSIERYSNPTKQTSLKRNKNSLDTILRTGLNGSHHNSTLVGSPGNNGLFNVILLPRSTNQKRIWRISVSFNSHANVRLERCMPACQHARRCSIFLPPSFSGVTYYFRIPTNFEASIFQTFRTFGA